MLTRTPAPTDFLLPLPDLEQPMAAPSTSSAEPPMATEAELDFPVPAENFGLGELAQPENYWNAENSSSANDDFAFPLPDFTFEDASAISSQAEADDGLADLFGFEETAPPDLPLEAINLSEKDLHGTTPYAEPAPLEVANLYDAELFSFAEAPQPAESLHYTFNPAETSNDAEPTDQSDDTFTFNTFEFADPARADMQATAPFRLDDLPVYKPENYEDEAKDDATVSNTTPVNGALDGLFISPTFESGFSNALPELPDFSTQVDEAAQPTYPNLPQEDKALDTLEPTVTPAEPDFALPDFANFEMDELFTSASKPEEPISASQPDFTNLYDTAGRTSEEFKFDNLFSDELPPLETNDALFEDINTSPSFYPFELPEETAINPAKAANTTEPEFQPDSMPTEPALPALEPVLSAQTVPGMLEQPEIAPENEENLLDELNAFESRLKQTTGELSAQIFEEFDKVEDDYGEEMPATSTIPDFMADPPQLTINPEELRRSGTDELQSRQSGSEGLRRARGSGMLTERLSTGNLSGGRRPSTGELNAARQGTSRLNPTRRPGTGELEGKTADDSDPVAVPLDQLDFAEGDPSLAGFVPVEPPVLPPTLQEYEFEEDAAAWSPGMVDKDEPAYFADLDVTTSPGLDFTMATAKPGEAEYSTPEPSEGDIEAFERLMVESGATLPSSPPSAPTEPAVPLVPTRQPVTPAETNPIETKLPDFDEDLFGEAAPPALPESTLPEDAGLARLGTEKLSLEEAMRYSRQRTGGTGILYDDFDLNEPSPSEIIKYEEERKMATSEFNFEQPLENPLKPFSLEHSQNTPFDFPPANRTNLGGGVIAVELANVRVRPSFAEGTVLRTAEEGERLEFDGWEDGPELQGDTRWYHIRGGGGWIHCVLVQLDRPARF